LLTKEFRVELNAYDVRLPGGKVFDSLDEYAKALESGIDLTPMIESAARKEALEEAGVRSGNFTWLGKSVCGQTVEWDLHFFAVTDADIAGQQLEAHEDIETLLVTKAGAEDMCLDGTISEERSALQLLRYLRR